ncbi:unnamed protein product [Arctia plantaginis]|uniref:Glucuronosyltransferase n=1 Tax=Arctia plantaginis TaxID=874455 RepID=A0A8S0ZJY8_ARCPL|nr:unnamed protein product [Arctia plantaginis]
MNVPETKIFRLIDVSENIAFLEGDQTYRTGNILKQKLEIDPKENQILSRELARLTLPNENVIRLLENTSEHFDAVIVDLMESEVYAGLSVLYNCPMLWAFSMGAHWEVVRLIADTASPAYDIDYYAIDISPLTFTQRIKELLSRAEWNFYKSFYTMPVEREIYEQTFGPLLAKRGRKLPDYEDVIYNASLIFGNEHNAVLSRPSTPQNFKYIGGIHIDDPVKPLPKHLQSLMDNAPNGVIYFSMGSFWKSKDLPVNMIRELLVMFGELKETVLWKFEVNLKDLPKNVYIVQWAPQQSILAHPNCKLFISHGGLLSSIETIHFGVPIIGVPLLFD